MRLSQWIDRWEAESCHKEVEEVYKRGDSFYLRAHKIGGWPEHMSVFSEGGCEVGESRRV